MADKKQKEGGFAPNWRPDFRDADALPDIKAVRTNFLVNFVALALAVIATGWFVVNEYEAMAVQSQIDELKQSISDESKANKQNLKLSGEFKSLSPKAEDLVTFYEGYMFPLDVLLAFCESRPETIALQSIDIAKSSKNVGSKKKPVWQSYPRYTLNGVLKGESVEALRELDNYKVILQNLELFEGKLGPDSIEISQPVRNQRLGLFEFTIVIRLEEAS